MRKLVAAAVALLLVTAAGLVWVWRDAPKVSASLARVENVVAAAAAAIQQATSWNPTSQPVGDARADDRTSSRTATSPRTSRKADFAVDAGAAVLAPEAESKHPKLPPFELVDSRVSGTNTMELLVDESGDVRHVHLVTTPVRMSDMLLLSNAKTWKFYPAIKDGRPVKYRLAMSWNVTPR